MSKSPINKIKELTNFLPVKDISIANNFIQARDFESLKELVDSAIFKVKKNQRSPTPKEQYANINLTFLDELKSEIDSYLLILGMPKEEVYREVDFDILETDSFIDIDNF